MCKKSVSRVAVNLIQTTFEDLEVKVGTEFNRLLEEQEEFEEDLFEVFDDHNY
jgi:hypothetical protein